MPRARSLLLLIETERSDAGKRPQLAGGSFLDFSLGVPCLQPAHLCLRYTVVVAITNSIAALYQPRAQLLTQPSAGHYRRASVKKRSHYILQDTVYGSRRPACQPTLPEAQVDQSSIPKELLSCIALRL